MSDTSASTPEGVSVILLTKNNAAILPDLLESLRDFFLPQDELVVVDTGSTDDTLKVLKAHADLFLSSCQILERPDLCANGMHDLVRKYLPDHAAKLTEDPQFKDGFLADFAAARQIATDATKNDLVLWVDSDDVLVGAPALRNAITEVFSNPQADNLFLAYDYSFEEDGSCNTVLWRERVCRKSVSHWVGCCHESMIRRDGRMSQVVKFEGAKVVHKNGRPHRFSDVRNYAILRNAVDSAVEKGEWVDPRWQYYLGNACRGLSLWDESVRWYSATLSRSGSRDDRLSCALNIAGVFMLHGRFWRAIDWFFQAQKIHPSEPRSYFGIANCYFHLRRYRDCILYTELGRSIVPPQQITSVDPNSFDYHPSIFECLSYKELGRVEGTVSRARRILELRPNAAAGRELHDDMLGWAQREQIKATVDAATSLAFSRDGALDIIRSIKPEIRRYIPELQIESTCAPPRKSITFLCGKTHEPWDPTSGETGVGGSEKMVILLAREFAKAGYRVDVYGHPKPEHNYKNFDGVTYKPAEAFNPALERDILIVWRNWGYLDAPLRARKIFVDLHDVQNPADYTPERLAKVAGVFFKSKFHLEPVATKVGDKAIITRNALDPAHFLPIESPRVYNRILYTSSADRGFKRALRIFGRLKAIHPTAEMRAFYGFTPLYLQHAAAAEYQHFGDEQDTRHMLDYAEECHDLAQRHGVQLVGRVGWQQLADELKQASAVLYPTAFPEISCMSAMEAQAAGCIPVCAASGALPETVRGGLLFTPDSSDDEFVAALDGILRRGADLDTQRAEMSSAALSSFSIQTLSAAWLERFSS